MDISLARQDREVRTKILPYFADIRDYNCTESGAPQSGVLACKPTFRLPVMAESGTVGRRWAIALQHFVSMSRRTTDDQTPTSPALTPH